MKNKMWHIYGLVQDCSNSIGVTAVLHLTIDMHKSALSPFSPIKHPLECLAFASITRAILSMLHAENLLLLGLSPEVARANMM